MHCLLVDDSRTMRNIQKNVLSLIPGTTFAEAGDGLEALSVISSTPTGFNFMLIDWNMPNMDGLTLVKHIRERDKKTVLIMATTESEKSRVLEAIRAGINNYVVKPFTSEQLIAKVTETLAKARAAA